MAGHLLPRLKGMSVLSWPTSEEVSNQIAVEQLSSGTITWKDGAFSISSQKLDLGLRNSIESSVLLSSRSTGLTNTFYLVILIHLSTFIETNRTHKSFLLSPDWQFKRFLIECDETTIPIPSEYAGWEITYSNLPYIFHSENRWRRSHSWQQCNFMLPKSESCPRVLRTWSTVIGNHSIFRVCTYCRK